MALNNKVSMNDSTRDRTNEFYSVVGKNVDYAVPYCSARIKQLINRQHSQFQQVAKMISKDLAKTEFIQLEKLSQLAESLFYDNPQEIEILVDVIEQDLHNLSEQIALLHNFMVNEIMASSQTNNTVKTLLANVIAALRSNLSAISSEFKRTLEIRTENLSRREQYSSPVLSSGQSVDTIQIQEQQLN